MFELLHLSACGKGSYGAFNTVEYKLCIFQVERFTKRILLQNVFFAVSHLHFSQQVNSRFLSSFSNRIAT